MNRSRRPTNEPSYGRQLTVESARRMRRPSDDGGFSSSAESGSEAEGPTTTDYSLSNFLARIEKIQDMVVRIGRYTEEIERLHRQVLTAVNVDEASRLSRTIDELTALVTDQANQVRTMLMGASEENRWLQDNPGTVSSSDMRIRKTQQAKHARRFMETMKRYQEMQTGFKSKYKSQLERQYLIIKPGASRQELDSLVESDGVAVLSQQMFSMANRSLARKQLDEMKERHQDILAIEKSIQELHQMFLDMALIVDQQGELIDRVGEHVESSAVYTEKAAAQMESAVTAKRRGQRCKWIIAGIVIFILVGLGIYLAILFGTGGGGGSSSKSSKKGSRQQSVPSPRPKQNNPPNKPQQQPQKPQQPQSQQPQQQAPSVQPQTNFVDDAPAEDRKAPAQPPPVPPQKPQPNVSPKRGGRLPASFFEEDDKTTTDRQWNTSDTTIPSTSTGTGGDTSSATRNIPSRKRRR